MRPYQAAALDAARAALSRGCRAPLIVMPPGTGKTRLAAEACFLHEQLGGRPLFIAPRRELVDQATRALRTRGCQGRVATIQGIKDADATMVVLDEARHYVVGREWGRLREQLPQAIFLGLDGTPERGDGVGLGNMFDALIEGISTKDAISGGYLVPVDIKRPDRVLASHELAMDPPDALAKHGRGSAVVFAKSVELAQKYAAQIPNAAAVWGEMPTAQRDAVLAAYAAGEIRALCNANLLCEGWDVPRTETIVLARGFGTRGGYLQALARGMRPYAGKTSCLVLDLRGISHLHGGPEEPCTWHLEGKACRRGSDDPNIRFCAVCGAVVMVTDSACAQCGREGTHRMRPPRVLGLPIDRFATRRREPDELRAKALKRWIDTGKAKSLAHARHIYRGVYGEFPPPTVLSLLRSA